jgi:hypothetical protein
MSSHTTERIFAPRLRTILLDRIERILSSGYVPNGQDILRSRMPTIGTLETDLAVDATSGRGAVDGQTAVQIHRCGRTVWERKKVSWNCTFSLSIAMME